MLEVNGKSASPEAKKRLRAPLFSLSAYDLHKRLVNNYLLGQKGSAKQLQRDTSRDKVDIDVIREHHKFLWDETAVPASWEQRLAKKYYDKLFKEFCICDLSYFKENKVAMRWRTEQELVIGKGQFICGENKCPSQENLRTWEVNFAYVESGKKQNALVKARLCPGCSNKLNYHHRKREVKARRRSRKLGVGEDEATKKRKTESVKQQVVEPSASGSAEQTQADAEEEEAKAWKAGHNPDEKSREEEFQDYLEELLF